MVLDPLEDGEEVRSLDRDDVVREGDDERARAVEPGLVAVGIAEEFAVADQEAQLQADLLVAAGGVDQRVRAEALLARRSGSGSGRSSGGAAGGGDGAAVGVLPAAICSARVLPGVPLKTSFIVPCRLEFRGLPPFVNLADFAANVIQFLQGVRPRQAGEAVEPLDLFEDAVAARGGLGGAEGRAVSPAGTAASSVAARRTPERRTAASRASLSSV